MTSERANGHGDQRKQLLLLRQTFRQKIVNDDSLHGSVVANTSLIRCRAGAQKSGP